MANPDEFAWTPEQQARGRALCLTEADRWRRQAAQLRECAAQARLAPNERAALLGRRPGVRTGAPLPSGVPADDQPARRLIRHSAHARAMCRSADKAKSRAAAGNVGRRP